MTPRRKAEIDGFRRDVRMAILLMAAGTLFGAALAWSILW
jgi:hypothetical protein